MFKILQKTLRTGIVTASYPKGTSPAGRHFRGLPEFSLERWRDARPAADVCTAGAIALCDQQSSRRVTVDYGRCIFCGQCADVAADGAIRITREFELAAHDRSSLVFTADYELNNDGSHHRLTATSLGNADGAAHGAGKRLRATIQSVLGRSLAIREVDAGSCNGCELEIIALNNPVNEIERFGIRFVASPRHADMLLVTGPVTRNMELALRKTWEAAPEPRVVVAVGACGISGGIFGTNYATRGGVDRVIPVDVYIPGCPPRPEALLHGILLAVGRLASRPQRAL